MAPLINYTLPTMQLVCNLVMPEVPDSKSANLTQDLTLNQTGTKEGSVVKVIEAGPNQFLETSTSRTDPGELPDGYVAYPEIGMAYKVYDEEVPWIVALRRCVNEGAGLAVINSWRKYEAVKDHPHFTGYPNVGIVRMDGEWVNANTGSPVTTDIPWLEGHPTNDRDCVSFSSLHGLGDYRCNNEYNYICERPLIGNQS